MALCPFAIKQLITADMAGRKHTPTRMTLHTAVSSAKNLYNGRIARNGTYAHFYVFSDGTLYQYRDTAYAARADAQGNFGSISVETWDGAKERTWTNAQVATLAKLFAWVNKTHPTVPSRLATVANVKGLAWHRLGCRGNFGGYNPNNILTWSGNQTGPVWSNAFGKTCPYNTRIKQIPGILSKSKKPTTGRSTTKPKSPTSTGKHKANAVDDVTLTKRLKSMGYMTSGMTLEQGITAYQRGQKYMPAMLIDGYWGPLQEKHYKWVKKLQTALNKWKSTSPKLVVDGDYASITFRAVGRLQKNNFNGAYKAAVRSIYGKKARPVIDNVPGSVTCKMLGISTHPNA